MPVSFRTFRNAPIAILVWGLIVGPAPSMSLGSAAPPPLAENVKSVFRPELPADAMEIRQAMTAATTDRVISIRGHVALSKDAFDSTSAVFMLVDESARTGPRPRPSDDLPDTDHGIAASARALVRVTDDRGTPLPGSLLNVHGLRPGAEVFVTGRVHAANGTDVLVIDARAIHVPRDPVPPGVFVDAPPEGAVDVTEVLRKGSLASGQRVVLRGRVGGSERPFVDGRAVLTLVGRGLKACNEVEGDACVTPWDYCCEPRDQIAANSVTVRLVDERGRVLRTDLKGRRGLRELSEVVVAGVVTTARDKAVVVDATSLHAVR